MDTVNAVSVAAASFDPEAITPLHIVLAIAANLVWAWMILRDRRRARRQADRENPE